MSAVNVLSQLGRLARIKAYRAIPHLSVLKAYLKGLRSGRAFDRVGEVPGRHYLDDFPLHDPSLWRGMTKGGQASDEVVEAAGFEPLDRLYHGSYNIFDDLKIKPGDMGVHFSHKPMTTVVRGYDQPLGRYDIGELVDAPEGVDTMEGLLRAFYDMGKKAPKGKEVAKWFEGKPRPFSHEEWAKYDFGGPGGSWDFMAVNPRRLGPEFNIYPFYTKEGLKKLEMPDVGRWEKPDAVIDHLRDLEDQGGYFSSLAMPRYSNPDYFPEALDFWRKHKGDLGSIYRGSSWPDPEPVSLFIKDLLKKEGYEGISYPNWMEGMGEMSHLIFDPDKSLRSPYAAFKGESGLMASLLPLVSLLRGEDR